MCKQLTVTATGFNFHLRKYGNVSTIIVTLTFHCRLYIYSVHRFYNIPYDMVCSIQVWPTLELEQYDTLPQAIEHCFKKLAFKVFLKLKTP